MDLKKVVQKQKELADYLSASHAMECVDEELYPQLVVALARLLRLDDSEVLCSSLLDLIDRKLTPEVIQALSWRLAGNTLRLRHGQPVPIWTHQSECEWAPVQIQEVRVEKRARKGQEEHGAWLHYLVLAGSAAGLSFRRWWSRAYVSRWRSLLGFSKPRVRPDRWPEGKPFFPLEDLTQLTRFRFQVKLEPDYCREKPSFRSWRCTEAMLDWNRRLLTRRSRALTPCPYGLKLACHRCPVGYDRCVAGCHPLSRLASKEGDS